METVGIMGFGYVGHAVWVTLKDHHDRVPWYDPAPTPYGLTQFPEAAADRVSEPPDVDIVFICVPTPEGIDGRPVLGFVEQAVAQTPRNALVVLKSTVPPGTTRSLGIRFSRQIVFEPETLRARYAVEDMRADRELIVGTDHMDLGIRVALAHDRAATIVSPEAAEMYKYAANGMLAMQVSWANDLYDLCHAIALPWEDVAKLLRRDKRFTPTHWDVPGPDGQRGWGGACFPKDTAALVAFAASRYLRLPTLEGALLTNKRVRD